MSDDGKEESGGYEEKVRCLQIDLSQNGMRNHWIPIIPVFSDHDFSLFSIKMQIKYVSVIAQPLASKKTTKRIHKLVRKASQAKIVRRGVKEVVKALRKGEKGFCIIAGDISPVDVITHLPIMCEDRNIPYFYVPSKHDLGAAATTKRPT